MGGRGGWRAGTFRGRGVARGVARALARHGGEAGKIVNMMVRFDDVAIDAICGRRATILQAGAAVAWHAGMKKKNQKSNKTERERERNGTERRKRRGAKSAWLRQADKQGG